MKNYTIQRPSLRLQYQMGTAAMITLVLGCSDPADLGENQVDGGVTEQDSGGAGNDATESPDGGEIGDPLDITCDKTIGPEIAEDSRFDGLEEGDTLCLDDGQYSGGLIVPSGIRIASMRVGGARFEGGDDPWSAILLMEGRGSSVVGVAFSKPDNPNSNACQVSGENNTLQFTSCSHGGTHKHKIPLRIGGTGHLVEDSWFYGEGRYVVQCFIGDHMTFRRNIARWDSTAPNEASEPNATFQNYNCSDNVWENNISLDYGVPETAMRFGGDFYMSNHQDIYPELNHDVRYYGNMVVNHSAGTENSRGFRADNNHSSSIVGGMVVDHFERGVELDFVIKGNYQTSILGCTRINVGRESVDCGREADITSRYVNGEKTTTPLFPFVSENFAKADMCASNERQSDWCVYTGSLQDYVLGN